MAACQTKAGLLAACLPACRRLMSETTSKVDIG